MDRDHRSAPVKGEMHGFAALDRCLVDDLSAGTPIRTQHAARQLLTTRRGVRLRLSCILYALPSDTRSRIRIQKRMSRLRQHRDSGSGLDRRFRCGYNSAKDAEHLLHQIPDSMLTATVCVEYQLLIFKHTEIDRTFYAFLYVSLSVFTVSLCLL